MSALTLTTTFATETCCNCYIAFAVPIEYQRKLRRNHNWFYCPNGHKQYYSAESDLDEQKRLRRKAEQRQNREISRHDQTRTLLRETERSRNAHKGAATRIKNRVAAGVCPCCNRTFKQLAAHMKNKHPNYTKAPA